MQTQKIFLSIVLIIFFSFNISYAQKNTIGVFAGPNYMRSVNFFSFDRQFELMDNQNHVPGFSVGVDYRINISEKYAASFGLIYMHRRFHNNIDPLSYEYGYQDRGVINSYRFNYLNLPLKVGRSFGSQKNWYIDMGVVPEILLTSRQKVTVIDDHYAKYEIPALRRFSFSGIAEVGYVYPLERIDLFSSVSIWYNIISPDKNASDEIWFNINSSNKYRHHGVQLKFGLRWHIKNRKDQ